MKKLLLLALLSLLVNVSAAAEESGYVPIGLGGDTCSQFIEAREDGEIRRDWSKWNKYQSWLAGFLTAFNLLDANTVDILGVSSFRVAMDYVTNFCEEDPTRQFVEAAEALLAELHPDRITN